MLILVYTFMIRIGTLVEPIVYKTIPTDNVWIKAFFDSAQNPLILSIIGCIIIFIQAVLVNRIVVHHKMAREVTLFAAIAYIIFVSIIAENNFLMPILIANTFLILSIDNFVGTYKEVDSTIGLFNGGFFLGLAAVIYFPYTLFLFFGLLTILILRTFKPTEVIQFVLGFLVPYLFTFTYKYWFNIDNSDFEFIKNIFIRLPKFNFQFPVVSYLTILILILAVVWAIINYGNLLAKKPIQSQKKIDIVYWVMLFCLISFLIFNTAQFTHLISLAVPLSIFVGIWLSEIKNKMLPEVIHILLIAVIFIAQFKLINF
jgi:hypothetical protein